MPACLLIDNWTLQSVGELLCKGFDGQTAHEMAFSETGRSFRYVEVSQNLIRLECLLQLLSNVVFADELYVDTVFVNSWEGVTPLDVLRRERVVIGKPFYEVAEGWVPRREAIVEELCFCAKVRRVHAENVRQYEKDKSWADQLLSQLVWGGAGYLARASYFELPYIGHPLRERLFVRSTLLQGPSPAQRQFEEFVSGERMKLFRRLDSSGCFARLSLPPTAAEVIKESRSVDDLLKVALQFRSEFGRLREWLVELQKAIDKENLKGLAKQRKLLESVARDVDARTSLHPDGQTTLQIGWNWLKVTTKSGSPVNSLQNLFGVRAAMQKLIWAPPGREAFRKLLGFFDEGNSRYSRELEREFMARSGATPS